MTSSAGRKPVRRRWLFRLLVLVVVLFAVYSAAWFYAANRLETFAADQIAAFNQTGRSADCGKAAASGFPLGMSFSCDSVRFDDPDQQVSLSAAGFSAGIQAYDPFQLVARLDSPAAVSAPGAGELTFDWAKLGASVRLATDFPDAADAAIDKLAAGRKAEGTVASLVKADHAEAHMKKDGADLVLAARLTGAALDPQLSKGAALPPLGADVDVTIKDGVAWAQSGAGDLRGQSGTIRTLALSTGETSGLSVAGTFAVGEDGLLDADLQVTVRNPKALGEQLATAFPNDADRFRTAMSGLAMMGNNATLPLKISRGKARLGFVPLPDIPPL
jgi:hypothetical protein